MPLYDIACPFCGEVVEVTMTLATKDEFDSGQENFPCPVCECDMVKVISKPKMIKIARGGNVLSRGVENGRIKPIEVPKMPKFKQYGK
jgi:hypothetical protein